ncbi:hypothetical protein CBM2617_A200007 [Cupriavidus taiwanensis]|nr:hypothetical protein CBM2617_A200007 [Cupriavidus taiwanensis]SOZ86285.1 hypothetical protein CBM2621_A170007 [Cupriavidus taiwanensis]SPD43906.1 protein of unknown function [Cupriavidus taiwanensis]
MLSVLKCVPAIEVLQQRHYS